MSEPIVSDTDYSNADREPVDYLRFWFWIVLLFLNLLFWAVVASGLNYLVQLIAGGL